jgi:hypothetical protein
MLSDMFYQIALGDINGVPLEVRSELRIRMQEIATRVASIPRHHSFWAKAADHELPIDVHGWRFFYRVDGTAHKIDVVRGTQLVIV